MRKQEEQSRNTSQDLYLPNNVDVVDHQLGMVVVMMMMMMIKTMTLTIPLGFGEEVIRRCEDSLGWKRFGENKQYLSQLETVCNAAPKQDTFAENFIVKIQNLDQRELAVQAKQVQHEEEPGFGVNITFFSLQLFFK